jgi:NADH dehydrogenase FAD-containing subunit
VNFLCGQAQHLDAANQRVWVQTPQGLQTLAYDRLLIALGSASDTDTVPGAKEHALAVGNPQDSLRLAARLADVAAQGGQALVVGGGLTGLETACEIAEAYPRLRVSLVTAGRLGTGLSVRGLAHVRQTLARLGITTQEQRPVGVVDADAVITTDQAVIPTDVCVWAGSFRASPLMQSWGLRVNARGQVLINATMQTLDDEAIYAAGDSAAFDDPQALPIRMACATAIPMGMHAADSLAAHLSGQMARPFGFGYALQCLSLGRRDGLIQYVRSDDQPTGYILTGRTAAMMKEAVCQFARLSASAGWAVRRYRWMQTHHFSAESGAKPSSLVPSA